MDAIEFGVAHDDGQRASEFSLAEIVLVGVSRVGKTPLSMYLSVLGWKVANVPLIKDIAPPPELLQIDWRRVVGLSIEPGQLVAYRQWRQPRLGAPLESDYVAPAKLYEEMEVALAFFGRQRFVNLDVTDKPLETSAEQVVELVTRRLRA